MPEKTSTSSQMEKLQQIMKKKSIAVSSGKGGVGKTTTAVNLALYYARKNLRICLIDVDPLSDVATLLDIKEPVHVIEEQLAITEEATLDSYLYKAFNNLEILFPLSKLKKHDSRMIFDKIYKEHTMELINRFDLFIFDMPAGIRTEDNLAFLPYMRALVMVTNAEPSAHVSAGGYLKVVDEICPGLPFFFWHNKFEKNPGSSFDPEDVVGNYNRNSPEEARLGKRILSRIDNLAYIPRDPSMDLLQSNPSITLNVQRSLVDQLEFLKEENIKLLATRCGIHEATIELIKYYLIHLPSDKDLKEFVVGLGQYLSVFYTNKIGDIPAGTQIFTREEILTFKKLYLLMKKDALHNSLLKNIDNLQESIKARENEKRLFFVGNTTVNDKTIDLNLGNLLIKLNANSELYPVTMKYTAGLLLFYFALYKLFQSTIMLKEINKFIPVRKSTKGLIIRDKRTQIRNLIENNALYKKRYFTLIKRLFPVISKQLTTLVKAFHLNNLYYKEESGAIKKDAYVKLFSHFIHDAVNSGLGVITSFNFRPSAMAFNEGAEKLLAKLMKGA